MRLGISLGLINLMGLGMMLNGIMLPRSLTAHSLRDQQSWNEAVRSVHGLWRSCRGLVHGSIFALPGGDDLSGSRYCDRLCLVFLDFFEYNCNWFF